MSVDDRIESFVRYCGAVPLEARRLLDYEAHIHAAPWVQRLIGKGIACEYVAGYAHGASWWTFCFDRRSASERQNEGAEVWRVEAYDSIGRGWSETFKYWPELDLWQLTVSSSTPDENGAESRSP